MDSGCQKLAENIWFVWSKRSYSGQNLSFHRCGQTECDVGARIMETEFAMSDLRHQVSLIIGKCNDKHKYRSWGGGNAGDVWTLVVCVKRQNCGDE